MRGSGILENQIYSSFRTKSIEAYFIKQTIIYSKRGWLNFNDQLTVGIIICYSDKLFFVCSKILKIREQKIMVMKKWIMSHIDQTVGCRYEVIQQSLDQMDMWKVIIVLAVNLLVDVFCYLYNKKWNPERIMFFIPNMSFIHYGCYLYLLTACFELFFHTVLFIYWKCLLET